MNNPQRKGDVRSSQEGAITHHKGGTTLTGDATLLLRAISCKQALELNVKGSGMMLTRTATPSNMCLIASEFTGKQYNPRSKKNKQQAIKDLETWIETMRAAIPHIDETKE